jgi:hypothetical protein
MGECQGVVGESPAIRAGQHTEVALVGIKGWGRDHTWSNVAAAISSGLPPSHRIQSNSAPRQPFAS